MYTCNIAKIPKVYNFKNPSGSDKYCEHPTTNFANLWVLHKISEIHTLKSQQLFGFLEEH